jgi:hypothetical protein
MMLYKIISKLLTQNANKVTPISKHKIPDEAGILEKT